MKKINILNESQYFKRLIFTIIYKKYISKFTQKITERKKKEKMCEDPKTCSDFTSLFIKFSILKSMMITLHNSKMAMHTCLLPPTIVYVLLEIAEGNLLLR